MSLENAILNRSTLLQTLGKNALNVKYPKEFELYVCALELLDSSNTTLRYFVFPVMPSSIDENMPQITNVKKTLAGVTVLSTPTFIPTDINLSGNFGRSFKVLLGGDFLDFISSFKNNASKGGEPDFFDERVKSGYGCIKILEEIIKESNNVDADGGLRKLILHNPSIGNSYFVKAMNLKFNQNEQMNMIWNYNVQFKSIAPLDSLFSKSQLEGSAAKLVATAFAQKQVDNLVNKIGSLIAKIN